MLRRHDKMYPAETGSITAKEGRRSRRMNINREREKGGGGVGLYVGVGEQV